MIEVIPAILPKDYEDLKNKLALARGAAPVVQIDICDGQFVKNTTWPFANGEYDQHFKRILDEQEGIPFWEDMDFELDLMVVDAVENFDIYMSLGARRMIFHLEAVGDLVEFKEFLEGIDPFVREAVELGVAINTTTPVDKILPLVPVLNFVQVMGIEHVGFQGQDFDPRALEHIKNLHERFPELAISVDGAVSLETKDELVAAGATRLVAGSAVFNTDDIMNAIERLGS